ncbi:MAG: hypothetical protein AABX03_05305 [Nanoarchaeota archaeon]
MNLTRVKINQLQPSDVPRKDTLKFYSSLTLEQLGKLDHKPQVWVTNEGLIVSDGNNYIFENARRGLEEVEVDLCGDGSNFGFPTEDTLNDIGYLRNIGIKSPYDFFRLFPNDPRNPLPIWSYAA